MRAIIFGLFGHVVALRIHPKEHHPTAQWGSVKLKQHEKVHNSSVNVVEKIVPHKSPVHVSTQHAAPPKKVDASPTRKAKRVVPSANRVGHAAKIETVPVHHHREEHTHRRVFLQDVVAGLETLQTVAANAHRDQENRYEMEKQRCEKYSKMSRSNQKHVISKCKKSLSFFEASLKNSVGEVSTAKRAYDALHRYVGLLGDASVRHSRQFTKAPVVGRARVVQEAVVANADPMALHAARVMGFNQNDVANVASLGRDFYAQHPDAKVKGALLPETVKQMFYQEMQQDGLDVFASEMFSAKTVEGIRRMKDKMDQESRFKGYALPDHDDPANMDENEVLEEDDDTLGLDSEEEGDDNDRIPGTDGSELSDTQRAQRDGEPLQFVGIPQTFDKKQLAMARNNSAGAQSLLQKEAHKLASPMLYAVVEKCSHHRSPMFIEKTIADALQEVESEKKDGRFSEKAWCDNNLGNLRDHRISLAQFKMSTDMEGRFASQKELLDARIHATAGLVRDTIAMMQAREVENDVEVAHAQDLVSTWKDAMNQATSFAQSLSVFGGHGVYVPGSNAVRKNVVQGLNHAARVLQQHISELSLKTKKHLADEAQWKKNAQLQLVTLETEMARAKHTHTEYKALHGASKEVVGVAQQNLDEAQAIRDEMVKACTQDSGEIEKRRQEEAVVLKRALAMLQ